MVWSVVNRLFYFVNFYPQFFLCHSLFSKGNHLLSESYLLPRSVEGGTPITRDYLLFLLSSPCFVSLPRNILFPPLPAFPCSSHHRFCCYALMHFRILPISSVVLTYTHLSVLSIRSLKPCFSNPFSTWIFTLLIWSTCYRLRNWVLVQCQSPLLVVF